MEEEPKISKFRVLETEEMWEAQLEQLMEAGLLYVEANSALEKRKKAFSVAKSKFMRSINKPTGGRGRPSSARR